MKAFVLGFYGAGNVGDELLAHIAGTWLSDFGVTPVFASFDADRSRNLFPKWQFVDIDDLNHIANELLQADVFVLGGGGIFQEHNKLEINQLYSFPGREVAIFAQLCLMARQFELPTIYWAAGVGPLVSKQARDIVAELFQHTDAISVRDKESAALLVSLGVNRKISVAADPTWSSEFDWGLSTSQTPAEEPPIVAVVPRNWPFDPAFLDKLKSSLMIFIEKGWRIRVINFGGLNDDDTVDQLVAGLPDQAIEILDASVDPLNAAASFRGTRAAVVMRMHSLILSIKAGLPVVAIEYDPKVSAVAAAAELDSSLRLPIDASEANYYAAMSHLLEAAAQRGLPSAGAPQAAQFGISADRLAAFARGAAEQKQILREFIDRVSAARPLRSWSAGGFNWISAWSPDRPPIPANQIMAGVLNQIEQLDAMIQQSPGAEDGRRLLLERLEKIRSAVQVIGERPPFPTKTSEIKSASPFEIGLVASSDEQTPAVTMWLHAAEEQGVPMSVVTIDELESVWSKHRQQFAALVLPDRLVRPKSPTFFDGLRRFVENGGRVLVVFDAAVFSRQGRYALGRSALSDMVGVDYALYGKKGARMVTVGPVFASAASSRKLGIPPGLTVSVPARATQSPFSLQLTSYGYPELNYRSLTTSGRYDGEPLLVGPQGQIVAGIRNLGEGKVIFANLQLGYLKQDCTDGWALHRFLRLLARESGLPTLAMTPGGVGGMIMNIHVDSGKAIEPLQKMVGSGMFEDGPFSIHVTAGPDCDAHGDKLGIDVPENLGFQRLLRVLASKGHEIGSHGGWIHNYWAHNVTEESGHRDEPLLDLNVRALSEAIGDRIRVYSSPVGLHPRWVTDWLRQHGFVAHYTTANHAAAPTREYRDGKLDDRSFWSFPIVTCGGAASFEEASWAGLDERTDIIPFFKAITNFVADQHEVRMFYFHPTGVHLYENALAAWIAEARILGGRFRWYSMATLADFLNRRSAARWKFMRGEDCDLVEAETLDNLADLTWLIPGDRYERPNVVEGIAEIKSDGADWTVTAMEGRRLVIHLAHAKIDRLRLAVHQSVQIEVERQALLDQVQELSLSLDNAALIAKDQREETARLRRRVDKLEDENRIAVQARQEESAKNLQLRIELERAQRKLESDENAAALKREIEFARWKINALERSVSWRISAPVRGFGTGLRHLLSLMPIRLSSPIRRAARRVLGRRSPVPLLLGQERSQSSDRELQLEKIREAHAGKPIIVFRPLIEWNIPLHQRPQHLAIELSRQNFLYFYCTPNTSFDFLDGIRQLDESCYLIDCYERACALRGQKILHVYAADQQFGMEELQNACATFDTILYEYIDELHADIAGREIPQSILERHKFAISNPSIVCVTSASRLFEEVRAHRIDNVLLSTNGVEFKHFAGRDRALPAPDLIKDFVGCDHRPVIGYFGAFAKWFDYELIIHFARTRPEYKVLLIGWDYDGSILEHDFKSLSNVKVIGPINYSVLPQYARFFDVSVIPFLINDITRSTSPIKLFEYMALGKPIVTTAMPECQKYRSPLIADSPEHFVEQIDHALTLRHDPNYVALLHKEAMENVWQAKARPIADLLRSRLAEADLAVTTP